MSRYATRTELEASIRRTIETDHNRTNLPTTIEAYNLAGVFRDLGVLGDRRFGWTFDLPTGVSFGDVLRANLRKGWEPLPVVSRAGLRDQIEQTLAAFDDLDEQWAAACAKNEGDPPARVWERDDDARRAAAVDLIDLMRQTVQVVDEEDVQQLRAVDPEVIVMLWPDPETSEPETDDLVVVCPRCHAANPGVWVADLAERWCEGNLQLEPDLTTQVVDGAFCRAPNPDAGLPVIEVRYDGTGDYEHQAYRCSTCSGRVSLPDWMSEQVIF